MAPKRAPKAKAKGHPKAKAKGAARRLRMALHRPAAAVAAVRRRPAARLGNGGEGEDAQEVWKQGGEVDANKMEMRDLLQEPLVSIDNATYFHKNCKVAGKILGVNVGHPHSFLVIEPKGTTSDSLLQYLTGAADVRCRGHLCDAGCNSEEVADDIIHVKRLRRVKAGEEEGWMQNLEKILPMPEDELRELRVRERERREDPGGEVGAEKKTEKEAKESKKEKKDKKKKKEKERARKEEKESQDGDDALKNQGYRPRLAAQKEGKAMFGGTGMDPREKVRARVAKRARAYMKRKGTKEPSSSSGDSSTSSDDLGEERADETLFGEASKVRTLALEFPGALTCQAVFQMKTTLIQEAGLEEQGEKLTPVATSYFREHLMRRASGPVSRELQTLTAILDSLIKCKPCHAADIATQRLKSIEQSLVGSHWQVSQRLEVLPQDNPTLTARQEATAAQREVYEEAKVRAASMNAEGRQPRTGNQPKGKGDYKGQGKPGGKDKRDGKGKNKNDQGKKKDNEGWCQEKKR